MCMLILLYVESTINNMCLITDWENIKGSEEYPFMHSVFSSPFLLWLNYFLHYFSYYEHQRSYINYNANNFSQFLIYNASPSSSPQMNSAGKPEKLQVGYSGDFSIMSGALLATHSFGYCSLPLNYKISNFIHLTALVTFNYSF